MLHFKTGENLSARHRPSNSVYIIIQNTVLCLIILILAFYAYGQFVVHTPTFFNARCSSYTQIWSWKSPDGKIQSFIAPGYVKVPEPMAVDLESDLPDDIPEDTYLFLRSSSDLRVIIDGNEREYFHISYPPFPGGNTKAFWLPIRLYPEDAGKTLVLMRNDINSHNHSLGPCYIGNMQGFIRVEFQNNGFILLMAFTLLIFGGMTSVVSIVLRLIRKRSFPLMYLSFGVLASAFWLILDNFTYPFLFGKYYIDGVVEYLIVMLIPFAFISYLNLLQKRRYQIYCNIANGVLLADFFLWTFLHFTGISDFNDTMIPMNIILGVVLVSFIPLTVYDIMVKKNRDYFALSIGYAVLLTMVICEIVHINLNVHNNDGMFVSIGLLAVLVFAILHEINSLRMLQARTIRATESNRAKSTFITNISNEILTPINEIIDKNEQILRQDPTGDIREHSESIRRAGSSLLNIINDILDFSKIEQGKLEIINADYDIRALLLDVTSVIKSMADGKGLRFNIEISETLPTILYGDSARIREILINLLNNAVKYTPKGIVTLSVEMKEEASKKSVLVCCVKDTGIGIKDEDKDKLFKQFERLYFSKNISIDGSGLGLAITGNLLRLMNGTVECNSAYGVGTEFIVSLPQKITDPAPIGDFETYRLATLSDMKLSGTKVSDLKVSDTKVPDTTQDTHIFRAEDTGRALSDQLSNYETSTTAPAQSGSSTISATPTQNVSGTGSDASTQNVSGTGSDVSTQKMSNAVPVAPAENKSGGESETAGRSTSVIDSEVGLHYCGGMEDFYKDALSMYAEVLPEKMAELTEFLKKKDFVNYEVLVHSVKSNSLTIGATDLSETAKSLEHACKEGDHEFVELNHENMICMAEIVLEECRKML